MSMASGSKITANAKLTAILVRLCYTFPPRVINSVLTTIYQEQFYVPREL